MSQLIECVPNVSEGRRPEVVDALWEALGCEPGVVRLDRSSDASHNRTVFTIAGSARAVRGAVLRLFEATLAHVDMREHKGEHPRMGAVDVVPFVPVQGCDLAFCADLAREVAAEVASRFDLPVFLYAEAASHPGRKVLASIRKGEFEGLAEKLAKPEWQPDFGPAAPHPRAGATAIGARPFLIAYNLQLDTPRVQVAQAIAKAVRASGGGLPHIQAMGVDLAERGCAQVSMNLLDFEKTPIYRIQELVKAEAARYGARVVDSEIVGLVPQAALAESAAYYLQAGNWSPDLVLEERIRKEREAGQALTDLSVADFAAKLGSSDVTPGGGSAAALAGALGGALVGMVGHLTLKPRYEDVRETAEHLRDEGAHLQGELLEAVDADTEAYQGVVAAMALPRENDAEKAARSAAIQEATKAAAEVPLASARKALAAAELSLSALTHGNSNAASDAGVGGLLALAGLEGALLNVAINLGSIKDADWAKERADEAAALLARSGELRAELWKLLPERIPDVARFVAPDLADARAR
ncbi:MAG: glutamate formimidoyltransferase [Candidatus Sericytochromatia bacterium]|nr:glutamate formimidoyltransferase [Candidatus Tanganyikabacteria bacterium]